MPFQNNLNENNFSVYIVSSCSKQRQAILPVLECNIRNIYTESKSYLTIAKGEKK